MTLTQKQCLLRYLDYYRGDIDGIWGRQSRQATIDFQRAYMDSADGNFNCATEARILEVITAGETPKDNWWQDIRYFQRAEFRCPCGRCGGFPAEPVSSGVRCQAHNDELPNSAPNSYHIRGKAMDFCIQGVPGTKLLAYVRQLPVHYAYQIDDSFVHMDVS